ncbi:hypothetical protein [Cochleicola gelatinilyticus]|uniref:Uncharacterized protein n=1 Tax=Cochleicola gelatinilyticus TaxID=1763537 RepID=A0A167HNC4_9FLAO|nr:hypothetical protein [Cochleicola gelatinilyticus]OAB78794.1 hypothetical protein ULVI_09440 [Cochleicola gelatinilyticus]
MFFIACKDQPKKDSKIKEDTKEMAVNIPCSAPSDWFGGSIPVPAPEKFPQIDVTNCDFHQISWQYFLWLTEEVNGTPRFESLYTDKAILPEFKDDQYHILDLIEQALSKGILIDKNNRAVYGNIMINEIYRDYILDNKLYDPETMNGFDPTADFPVGALSAKATWKIVQPDEDASNLYTKKADIELLTLVDGFPRVPKNNPKIQKNVEVALVGFHIAVVVEGHSEFIWASFEFKDNAPNFAANQDPNGIVSDKDWLFYDANTIARQTNNDNVGIAKFIDENAQTVSPVTQVARQYINGGGDETNQKNITNLNENVASQISAQSVWRNYFEVGAVWFNTSKGTLAPNWNPNVVDSMVTGSIKLSNATIETFTQKVRSQNQCFSCHNSNAMTNVPTGMKLLGGKNINLSHILLNNYNDGKEIPLPN